MAVRRQSRDHCDHERLKTCLHTPKQRTFPTACSPTKHQLTKPRNKSLAGMLLRLILAGVLFALGVLVAYWARVTSPYDPGAFVQLRDAAAAYAVLNGVYVWKVKTAMRYVAALALVIAALSFAEYAWRFYF